MIRRMKNRTKIGMGLLLVLLLLIAATFAVYFWQIRLQKPNEINMAQHMHSVELASHSMQHHSQPVGEACESLKAIDNDAPVRRFDLTAAHTAIQLDNGKSVDAWTFNGTSPGPELRVTQGDRVVVTLHNQDIKEGVTIHWHGIVLPCSQDGVAGVSQDAVMPGEQFTYTFIAPSAGTFWYHSHQMSSIQAKKGLLGQFIVEPKEEDAYSSAKDIAVLMQELASTYVMNGKTNALSVPAKPGEYIRLRLTNGANDTLGIAVEGAPFQVIAMDGSNIHQPGRLSGIRLDIGAGQRYDLLIKLPEQGQVAVRGIEEEAIQMKLGSGPEPIQTENKELFSFIDYGMPVQDDSIDQVSFDQSYELKLGSSLFINTINGESFHEIPPLVVKEGEHIKIKLMNEGGGDHPFHIHGHTFRVLSKNGEKLSGSPIVLDTILTKKGETYELYLKADNPGLWMAHCHNLMHASMGMSMMLNYEGITTSYRVGTKSGNLPDL